jgi:CBS domain-containing protein
VLVNHVMKSPVVTVDHNGSVREAVEAMNKAEIGSVIICVDGKAIGIITERDILKFIGKGGDAEKTKVSEIMSKPLIVVGPETKLEEAVKFMISKNVLVSCIQTSLERLLHSFLS